MTIASYRDLRVWQLGMDLVEEVYRLTQGFPQHEMYGLTNQMRRAAVSIPSNIAEGHARGHTKEYLYHLSVAQASLAELGTQLEIAARLNYLASDQLGEVMEPVTALAKQLHSLRSVLSRKGD